MRDRKSVIAWLCTGAFMVALMVIIGGITRLTHSGLSMTDWKLILGAIPPMNEVEWNDAFEQYKQFPEFEKVNKHFELTDFKSIYFWEYLHRLIGRLIGIVFFIPFVVFAIRKNFNGVWIRRLLILFGLGGLQGFLGWFMVKSGLVDRPAVSHYRLAIHLAAAFLAFCYILWLVLRIAKPDRELSDTGNLPVLSRMTALVVSIQIILGAFVAGLKAGLVFPTWPKMGDDWMPDTVISGLQNTGVTSLFDTIVSVQFMHRTFAYVVVILVSVIWYRAYKTHLTGAPRLLANSLLIMVGIQFILGVLTLLYFVPVSLAVLHQVGALLTLAISVSLIYYLPLRTKS